MVSNESMKTKIEVWSDINCPFCYIGKRHLEKALESFAKDEILLEWKSFELDPMANPPKGADNADLLAQKYGRDRNWAIEMNQNLTQMAAKAGLSFHMDKVVPANSFQAHRLIHLAKKHHLQDAMKEKLLSAKFIEGKDINDQSVLNELGLFVGLAADELKKLWESEMFAQDVREDEANAGRLGIRGVPFFVFNGEVALSGAQPIEVFKEVLIEIKAPVREP